MSELEPAQQVSPAEETPQIDIGPDARVSFAPFKVLRVHGREPCLIALDTKNMVEISDETDIAIDILQKGGTISEAEAALKERTGDDYDVADLVMFLMQRGFVRSAGAWNAEFQAPTPSLLHRTLARVPEHVAAIVRHPLVIILVAIVIVQYTLTAILIPSARPVFALVHVTDRPALDLALNMVGILGMAALHEVAHYFMARSYGLSPKLQFTHRWYVITLTTDVTEAWTLPRRQQLAIFSAGVLFNGLVMGLATLPLVLAEQDLVTLSSSAAAWLRLIIFVNWLPLFFHFFLFARTDLYYILQALLNDRNLATDSMAFLGYQGRRIASRLRREPTLGCAQCGAACYAFDPYCQKCGSRRNVEDPRAYPFAFTRRRRLWTFGLVTTLSVLIFYPLIALAFLRLGVEGANLSVALGQTVTSGRWLLATEVFFALALTLLNLVFIALLVSMLLVRVLLGLGRMFLTLARALPASFAPLTRPIEWVASGFSRLKLDERTQRLQTMLSPMPQRPVPATARLPAKEEPA